MATEKRIVVTGEPRGYFGEGEADGAISPGMSIEMAADGLYDAQTSTQAESLKGGLKLAIEDALQGNTIDDAYADGDRVFWYTPLPGDVVLLLVKDGQTIAVGDNLIVEGAGSGLFVEAAGTETKYQAEALEAVSPSGANDHVKCRIL